MKRAVRSKLIDGRRVNIYQEGGKADKRTWRVNDEMHPPTHRRTLARARTPKRVPNASRQKPRQDTKKGRLVITILDQNTETKVEYDCKDVLMDLTWFNGGFCRSDS